jgi:hypothetical protein
MIIHHEYKDILPTVADLLEHSDRAADTPPGAVRSIPGHPWHDKVGVLDEARKMGCQKAEIEAALTFAGQGVAASDFMVTQVPQDSLNVGVGQKVVIVEYEPPLLNEGKN